MPARPPAHPPAVSRRFAPFRADAIIAHLEPIQRRYVELAAEPEYVRTVLADGALAASAVADQTLGWAKDAMGIVQPDAMPVLTVMPELRAELQPKAKIEA